MRSKFTRLTRTLKRIMRISASTAHPHSSSSHCRLHPHHHGSSSVQTHTATVPVLLEVNPNGGLDPLSSDSCVTANMKQFFPADHNNEIILHIQVCKAVLSESRTCCAIANLSSCALPACSSHHSFCSQQPCSLGCCALCWSLP